MEYWRAFGDNDERCLRCIYPARLNAASLATELAGIKQYLRANSDSRGNWPLCLLQNIWKSPPCLASDTYQLNSSSYVGILSITGCDAAVVAVVKPHNCVNWSRRWELLCDEVLPLLIVLVELAVVGCWFDGRRPLFIDEKFIDFNLFMISFFANRFSSSAKREYTWGSRKAAI